MKALKFLAVVVSTCLIVFAMAQSVTNNSGAAISEVSLASIDRGADADNMFPATSRYRLDASRSKFIAHARRGGLLWFKGHSHEIAVREFTGEVQLTPDTITPASLVIIAKSASMEESSSVFTEQQKKIINKELREIVLFPDQHPDIVFKSTNVTVESTGAGQYDLKIVGNLTLLGVTRPVRIPTKVTISGNELRAQGEFSIERSDFKVKATSAMHGLIRVKDKMKFTFDIVGHQL